MMTGELSIREKTIVCYDGITQWALAIHAWTKSAGSSEKTATA
jgi:hypothetical protein